jgi:hypothetical protein
MAASVPAPSKYVRFVVDKVALGETFLLSQYMASVLHHSVENNVNQHKGSMPGNLPTKLMLFKESKAISMEKYLQFLKFKLRKIFTSITVYNTTNYIAIWVSASKGAPEQRIKFSLRHDTIQLKSKTQV